MAFGYFMNINVPSRQTFTLCNKLAKKVQAQLGLKLDNAEASDKHQKKKTNQLSISSHL